MAGLNRSSGFTLVELMLATLIFSMVIAGLAAIYTTAFSQSGAVMRDARLKTSAMIAFKRMNMMLNGATRLDAPAKGTTGTILRGCSNMAPDGVRNTTAVGFGSFAFCIQTGAVGGCGTTASPAPCLFSYEWPGVCPSPAVGAGTCGGAISGQSPEMLSSRVLVPNGRADYFERTTTMAAGNQVNIGMAFQRDGVGKIPTMRYEVTTVAHAQFDARLGP